MKEAILVYTTLPLIIGSNFSSHHEQEFIMHLNTALAAKQLDWHVSLDESFGDSQAIKAKKPDALILKMAYNTNLIDTLLIKTKSTNLAH
ncbi:hypothetical protein ACPBEH_04205 [Latilactobacillus sp. 5-91]|uniref:hypothetical protein n=1 Tax=Latilactobacillus sp. 5-91 TaxID=3410924 RepID=UPI003C729A4B